MSLAGCNENGTRFQLILIMKAHLVMLVESVPCIKEMLEETRQGPFHHQHDTLRAGYYTEWGGDGLTGDKVGQVISNFIDNVLSRPSIPCAAPPIYGEKRLYNGRSALHREGLLSVPVMQCMGIPKRPACQNNLLCRLFPGGVVTKKIALFRVGDLWAL
jgi:hypothetical protein